MRPKPFKSCAAQRDHWIKTPSHKIRSLHDVERLHPEVWKGPAQVHAFVLPAGGSTFQNSSQLPMPNANPVPANRGLNTTCLAEPRTSSKVKWQSCSASQITFGTFTLEIRRETAGQRRLHEQRGVSIRKLLGFARLQLPLRATGPSPDKHLSFTKRLQLIRLRLRLLYLEQAIPQSSLVLIESSP